MSWPRDCFTVAACLQIAASHHEKAWNAALPLPPDGPAQMGEASSACCSTASDRSMSRSDASALPALVKRFAARTASGLDAAISPANWRAAASGSAANRVARPSSRASSPVTIRPENSRSRITSLRTSWRSSTVPAMSGISPQTISRIESRASGATMRMSAPRANCIPPPSACPWIAAITGTGRSRHCRATCWNRLALP